MANMEADGVHVQVHADLKLDAKEIDAIMHKNAAWPFDAENDGWNRMHVALTLDMERIEAGLAAMVKRLEAGTALQSWEVTNLSAIWTKFIAKLHHHHDIEEKVAFPMVTKIGINIPPKMSADHKTLMAMIDDLSARIASLAPGKSAKEDLEPVAAILAKHSAMKAEMCTHFKEEYDVGLLLVRKGMTCKQFKPVEKAIVATLTPDDMAYLLQGLPDDKARRWWMTTVPGIPGIICSLVMFPALRKHENSHVRMLEELKTGQRIAPQPTGCFSC